ncbi:diversity-generating retroelement protein Avd [Myxococcota bacterium]|nr:diversity-generating retroelement protein Avd [Myxococcota bacterium]
MIREKTEKSEEGKEGQGNVASLPLLTLWEGFVGELLERTEKFPKAARMTLTRRVEDLALEIFEELIEARYRKEKRTILEGVNRKLERLRLLVRLCHTRGYLSHGGLEQTSQRLVEAGRMLGGWLKSIGASQ